jgi:(R,R)-butanediol dehydrogenase / meso-butanediol dehydrogenase / diacetyl reductase
MKAVVWNGGSDVLVTTVSRPGQVPGRALVAPKYVGLCGTDLHICAGHHPRAQPGLVLGHEIVGELVHDSNSLPAGTHVFVNPLITCGQCDSCTRGLSHVCDRLGLIGIDQPGGAAEFVSVPSNSITPLRSDLNLKTAALIEPIAVVLHAARRSGFAIGDVAHVIGAGPIGLLMALILRQAGASRVTISEPSTLRAKTAQSFDFEVVDAPSTPKVNFVFDCTGHPSVSSTLTSWVRTGGTLMLVGVYPGVVELNLQELLFREITVRTARVYLDTDIAAAVSLISESRIPGVERLVSATFPMEQVEAAMQGLNSGKELKVLLAVGGS